MTKLIILFTMIITGMVCKAQVTENREATNFSQIEVANGIELFYLQNDEAQSIRVESTSREALKSIKTKSNNEILKIYNTSKEFSNSSKTKVFVTGNALHSIRGKSKARIFLQATAHVSDMTITLLDGAYFNGRILSAARIKLTTDATAEFNGRIETQNFIGNFKNKSRINLSGTAKKASITSNNKSYCNAKNFLVENTEIRSDNATVIITSKNNLVIDLIDNAKLTYFGQPQDVTIINATTNKIESTKNAKILLASK
jgi:hypothetical protein